MTEEDRACIHALPHLIVQIHEVPLEVVRKNVVLSSAAKREQRKGKRTVRQKKGQVTFFH